VDDDAAGPRGRLAALLRAHRTAAGLTQRQLAGKAGVSLGALEQGRTRRPRGQTLPRLAIHHRMPLAAALGSCCPEATQRIAT
jgi:transcriptional regulator with XRE-family HTH domain